MQVDTPMVGKRFVVGFFVLLTASCGVVWWWTGSEFAEGIFGNMLVGAVTLLCVDVLFNATLERQRQPAVRVAVEAASHVYSLGLKFISQLYGATVISGRITRAQHDELSCDSLDARMAPYLSRTPLREIAFAHPEAPAFQYMFEDALTLQQRVGEVLSAHGHYLNPSMVAALYDLGRDDLFNFTVQSGKIGAVPETFSEKAFDDFFVRMDKLKDEIRREDAEIARRLAPRGFMQMLTQPGLFENSKPTQPNPANAAEEPTA